MILTVTLNAALDVTYELDAVAWGGSNRVGSVRRRAGGKGVNVARVAAALGEDVVATGFAGGDIGNLIRADLEASGLRHDLFPVAGTSRSTLTTVETASDSRATVFNEPGPHISPGEWESFQEHFRRLAESAAVVVISGSLPPGVPNDAYATLASQTDAPVIIDADGATLSAGAAGRPALMKPNAEELTRATATTTPQAGAAALQAAGAHAVLVSLGEDGMLAVTPDGTWHARPPHSVEGNPTGAGDAAVAAAARALSTRDSWPELLRHAVALSAAAVRAPVAGDFDAATYTRFLPRVSIEGDPCPS